MPYIPAPTFHKSLAFHEEMGYPVDRLPRRTQMGGMEDQEGVTHVRDDAFVPIDGCQRIHWVSIPPVHPDTAFPRKTRRLPIPLICLVPARA